MKHWRYLVVTGVLVGLVSAAFSAEKIPLSPQGYVSDFAHLLTPETRAQIKQLAIQLKNQQRTELAVVTIDTTGDRPLEDFATELFAQWGIGQKGADNGLLLLVVKNDRKLRIEVGYGLEDKVPDVVSAEIRDVILSKFREGDYNGGILAGAQMLTQAVGGTLRLERSGRRQHSNGPNFGLWFFLFIIFIGILKSIFRAATGRPVVRSGSSIPWWLILLLGSGRGGGSSWSGGGFSGGGGGFGGFGGGMSGGGGASGSW